MSSRSPSPASTSRTISRPPTPQRLTDPPTGSYAPIPLPSGRFVFEYLPATDRYFVAHHRVIFRSHPPAPPVDSVEQPFQDSALALDVDIPESDRAESAAEEPSEPPSADDVKPAIPVEQVKVQAGARDFGINVAAFYARVGLEEAVRRKEARVMGWEVRSWGSAEWGSEEEGEGVDGAGKGSAGMDGADATAMLAEHAADGVQSSGKRRKRVKDAGSDKNEVVGDGRQKRVKHTAGKAPGDIVAAQRMAARSEKVDFPTGGGIVSPAEKATGTRQRTAVTGSQVAKETRIAPA